ncbi:hypothetical protein ACLOJK_034238 [Asimina triloba]
MDGDLQILGSKMKAAIITIQGACGPPNQQLRNDHTNNRGSSMSISMEQCPQRHGQQIFLLGFASSKTNLFSCNSKLASDSSIQAALIPCRIAET